MKRSSYTILLFCLCSCAGHVVPEQADEGSRIWLSAAVEMSEATRSPYMPDKASDGDTYHPASDNVLSANVWGSTTEYLFKEENDPEDYPPYPYDGNGTNGVDDSKVAIHTTATFRSGDPQLLSAAIYGKDGDAAPPVYFVAFHPTGWTTPGDDSEGKVATYTFDGNDDVMFAPQVSGHYATDFASSPELYFRHLLTWLRIEMKAENETVSNSWGLLKSITIRSNSAVTVDLTSDAYNAGNYKFEIEGTGSDAGIQKYNFNDITFSGETDMNFYRTGEEKVFEGSEMTVRKVFTDDVFPESGGYLIPGKPDGETEDIDPEEVAYVMCAPVNATKKKVVDGEDVSSEEYVITITTEKRAVTIPVDLQEEAGTPYVGSTRRKQFTLSLLFKMGNTVSVATSVKDWVPGGVVVSEFGDDDIK